MNNSFVKAYCKVFPIHITFCLSSGYVVDACVCVQIRIPLSVQRAPRFKMVKAVILKWCLLIPYQQCQGSYSGMPDLNTK